MPSSSETLAADVFVDCSGFAALLIGNALQTPFVSYAENLFNDAAIALPTPLDRPLHGPIMSQTIFTAVRHGWAWKIPLTRPHGNGYVYSTAFCSPDEAETELRPPTPAEAQHSLAAIDNLLDRCAQNYPDQRTLLQAIPLKPKEESLQLYLW